jgi:lysozyme
VIALLFVSILFIMPDNRINQLMREKYNSLRPRENPPANQDSYAFARKRARDKHNQEIYEQLSLHEGVEPSVYTDTKGKRTIGIGFNLEEPSNRKKAESLGLNVQDMLSGKKTLSDKEIKLLYNESIKQAADDANAFLPQAGRQPAVVQKVLIDMAFNLGRTKLNKFKNMRAALLEGDYNKAAEEMIDSNWYNQVGNRSKRLVEMMRSAAR